jgi:hypothetical protein
MIKRHLVLAVLLGFGVAALAGCGRPVIPGQQFRGEKARTSSVRPTTSPLPEKPVIEEGAQDAKVRIVAFFPIDDDHKLLIDLLKGFVREYPGKVYMKYIDYRTPTGQQAFENAKMTVPGVMINTKKDYVIEAKPQPYTVDFSQDMGRYWTAEDLKKAVVQEIALVYGKGASSGK